MLHALHHSERHALPVQHAHLHHLDLLTGHHLMHHQGCCCKISYVPCCDAQLKSRSQEMEEVTGMQASITKQLVAKERQLHSNSLELAGLQSGRANQVLASPHAEP